MTSSKKAAYVANGADLDQPFEDNELLNRKDDFPFEDPPWRVLDTDVEFQPMEIKTAGAAVTEEPEVDQASATEGSEQESEDEADSDEVAQVDEDPESSDEEELVKPAVIGLTEEEADARVQAAVAQKESELTAQFEAKIQVIESELTQVREETERVRVEVREDAEKEFKAQLDASRETYDALTQKVAKASENLSEFYEPLSKLAVHVGMQLVRGELTVGPTAIARLVQGCLDALEGYQPKKTPILKMHPADLEQYTDSLDGKPEGIQLRADETMARGDVSLQMDDTAVDDLIAHRIEKLANHIFGISHGLTDTVFRSPLSGESETLNAMDELDDFIEHEVDQGGASKDLQNDDEVVVLVEDASEAEAEAEAEASNLNDETGQQ